jgi:HK97 family phage prohead protease
MKFKNANFELKREPDHDGVFEGYASVFDIVDQGLDVVAPGAFTKSLGNRKIKMLWQHDQSQPIGVWDEVREDERGLFVKGRVLKEVQKGAEAQALMKAGALDSMSIGYRTVRAEEEGGGRVRKLLEIDLFEISLVTFPMLPEAVVTAVKSCTTIREFEAALRDVGFSQTEAKAIAADGYRGLATHRDGAVAEVVSEDLTTLISQIRQLQENLTNV